MPDVERVAAIACALMAVLKPGGRLLMVDSAYDPTRSFCTQMLSQHGIETVYYDPLAPNLDAQLASGPIRAIFLESPGSLGGDSGEPRRGLQRALGRRRESRGSLESECR